VRPGNAERQKLALKEPGEVAKVIANTTRENDGLKGDRIRLFSPVHWRFFSIVKVWEGIVYSL
jgi:hypothetical protein